MKKLLTLLFLISFSANATLSGLERTNFINLVGASCLDRQINAPMNKNIDRLILSKYCSCYATYLADTPSMTSKGMSRKEMAPIATKAGNYCANNY
jgi:hypothetical protein